MRYNFKQTTGHTGRSQNRYGFTIVELLIVIVVIGILAAITIVSYTGIQKQASAAVLRADLKNAQTQLGMIKAESGSFPETKDSLKFSEATNPEYTGDDSTYCLTVSSTIAQTSFYLDSTTNEIKEGKCTDHEGYVGGSVGEVALTCPSGFIVVPGNSLFETSDFCVMKYEAKNVGGVATSQPASAPWVNISQTDAMAVSVDACDGCHLISEAEWLTIAHDVLSVDGNWSGGVVGSGYVYNGHSDGAPSSTLAASSDDSAGYFGTNNSGTSGQRRTLTLTNGEVIWDMAGNVYDWTSGQVTNGQPGASGYAWREWNTIAGTGSLVPSPFPNYGTPAAINWTSGDGIGRIYSNSGEVGLRGFLRGGPSTNVSNAGVLALYLNHPPSMLNAFIGFRAAR